MHKEIFENFIKEHFPTDSSLLMEMFEHYYSWLVKENQNINLISRKTDMNTIWTRHFLDSIVPVPFISFDNKRILDFGTGGGLPGIPIAILYPKADMSLLDSRKKKIGAIQIAAQQLQCTNCSFFSCRIEEMGDQYTESFDIIVCRSVKMIPKYEKIVLNLLKPGGKLILYKSKNIADIAIFNNAIIHDKSTEQLGERKIIEIVKDSTL